MRALRQFLRAGVAAALALSTVSCAASQVEHAEGSPDALALAVLRAIHERDAVRLRELALNEREFREVVWPELPAADPERNLPFSYVWGDLRTRSDAHLAAALERHGGEVLHLVQVRFTGGTTDYRTFLVHRRTELTVVDDAGAEYELRLFGSVFEQNGRFKVFSYSVD
jgi:hypothetical protein